MVYHYGWRCVAGEHGPREDCGGCVTPHQSHFVADVGGIVKPGQCIEQVVIPGDLRRWSAGESALLLSEAVGVGSKDKQALPVVRCPHVGCSDTCPLRIPPDFGKVFQNLGESQCEVAAYVFEECESWSKMLNCVEHIGPKVPFVVCAFAVSGLRKGLARLRIASCKNVDWLAISNLLPVHAGYVTQVGHVWVVMVEDAGRGGVNLRKPSRGRVENLHDAHF
nr:MAG TPA_asm: hypothetical protein [Caudoviricetes sp.]